MQANTQTATPGDRVDAPSTGFARAIQASARLPLRAGTVSRLLASDGSDELFLRGWTGPLSLLSRAEKAVLASVTGDMTEAVAADVLVSYGYSLLTDSPGLGRHGVDLVLLSPEGTRVLAVEVKGTLRSGRWPRLGGGALAQMSAAWLDKADNPGMASWGLESQDIYGAVMLINFAELAFRLLVTGDFTSFWPVTAESQLRDLGWLDVAT
jgi:hypothetical protein